MLLLGVWKGKKAPSPRKNFVGAFRETGAKYFWLASGLITVLTLCRSSCGSQWFIPGLFALIDFFPLSVCPFPLSVTDNRLRRRINESLDHWVKIYRFDRHQIETARERESVCVSWSNGMESSRVESSRVESIIITIENDVSVHESPWRILELLLWKKKMTRQTAGRWILLGIVQSFLFVSWLSYRERINHERRLSS